MPRNRQQTADRIREAALGLLERDGFEGWGVNAIARAAGADKVLLYRYFGSIEGLLDEIVQATAFWPDPEELPQHSAEAFIEATARHLAARPAIGLLLTHPSARSPVSRIRLKAGADLDRWLAGLRARTTGNIPSSQLERLPALLTYEYLRGSSDLSPREMWSLLSPPLQWLSEPPEWSQEELPTELL